VSGGSSSTLGRSPGPTYTEVLATDTHAVRDVLVAERPGLFGDDDVPVARYLSREFHELEKRHVWGRTWQMACREEHLPVVGDTYRYTICDLDIDVVRVAVGESDATPTIPRFEGRVAGSGEAVAVDTWGGFVFVNPDAGCESLRSFLGELVDHFEPWHLEQRYVEAHVVKRIRANWKVVQEAFMESFHVGATHPQQLARLGDTNSRYDCYTTFNRALHPSGIPSPTLKWEPTEQEMLDWMLDVRADEHPPVVLPEGETVRSFVASVSREGLRPTIGDPAADALSDAELVDAMVYWVFPNLHPWAAYQRIVYRFRPDGDDHEASIMEVFLISPFTGERPPPAVPVELDFDDSFHGATQLGITARILEQDAYNLPRVQRGLHNVRSGSLRMALYQESRIRHFHALLTESIGTVGIRF
jgi:phenylpropionate dioxygenase-like ring-hydroxylating dioxygenase large terminal subunit